MKFHKNQDQKHDNKVIVDLASTPATKKTGYTFDELLKGTYLSHYETQENGKKKAIYKKMNWEKREPFMSFDEAMDWLVKHNQDNWETVRDAWGTFHGGNTGFPEYLIEKYQPQFSPEAFIRHHFNVDALGNILSARKV